MADLILETLDELLQDADTITLSELSTIIQHAYHRTPNTMKDAFRRAINFEYMGNWILSSVARSGSVFIDFASVASTLVVAHHNIMQAEQEDEQLLILQNVNSTWTAATVATVFAAGACSLISFANHMSPNRRHAQQTLDNAYIKSAIDVFSFETANLRMGETDNANLTILWDSAKKILLDQRDGRVYTMLTYADLAVDLKQLRAEYETAKLNV